MGVDIVSIPLLTTTSQHASPCFVFTRNRTSLLRSERLSLCQTHTCLCSFPGCQLTLSTFTNGSCDKAGAYIGLALLVFIYCGGSGPKGLFCLYFPYCYYCALHDQNSHFYWIFWIIWPKQKFANKIWYGKRLSCYDGSLWWFLSCYVNELLNYSLF